MVCACRSPTCFILSLLQTFGAPAIEKGTEIIVKYADAHWKACEDWNATLARTESKRASRACQRRNLDRSGAREEVWEQYDVSVWNDAVEICIPL